MKIYEYKCIKKNKLNKKSCGLFGSYFISLSKFSAKLKVSSIERDVNLKSIK